MRGWRTIVQTDRQTRNCVLFYIEFDSGRPGV